MFSRGIYRPRDKFFFSKIERHFARHMLAWGFGDFKGGEIFPWRNCPLRNCPRAKFPPPPVQVQEPKPSTVCTWNSILERPTGPVCTERRRLATSLGVGSIWLNPPQSRHLPHIRPCSLHSSQRLAHWCTRLQRGAGTSQATDSGAVDVSSKLASRVCWSRDLRISTTLLPLRQIPCFMHQGRRATYRGGGDLEWRNLAQQNCTKFRHGI